MIQMAVPSRLRPLLREYLVDLENLENSRNGRKFLEKEDKKNDITFLHNNTDLSFWLYEIVRGN